MDSGIIGIGVVLDAFLAFYLILGSIGIGYFFLRTGFKKSDSIQKEYRIGWSIVFGLSYSFVVIIFSLGAGFFGIGGMGFPEFTFIFAGLVFAAGVGLLKVRSVVLPNPRVAQKQAEVAKKEKQGHDAYEQVIEFDKPKETRMEIVEVEKAEKEKKVFKPGLFEKKPAMQPALQAKSGQTQSKTMLEFLELSKKAPENKYTQQSPAKQVMEKPAPFAEEKKQPQAKEPQTGGKFALAQKKPVEKKEPFHPFGIFKKDLQKQFRENAGIPPATPVEKPVQEQPVPQKLLQAPKKADLKSIIPQKPKAPEQQPQGMQAKQASIFQPRQAATEPRPVENSRQIKPVEETKEFSPLPEDKLDYFGLKEKEETPQEKPAAEETIPENETPLQRLLREKREKIFGLRKEKR